MKKIITMLCLVALITGCGKSTDWSKVRNLPSSKSLMNEISLRSDVKAVVISDTGVLCVAMDELSESKAEITAKYFLGMAKNQGVSVEACKIVSAYGFKTDYLTYMSGNKLAFENQKQ